MRLTQFWGKDNHSCVTYILNGNISTSTHAIGMCNTSSENSH